MPRRLHFFFIFFSPFALFWAIFFFTATFLGRSASGAGTSCCLTPLAPASCLEGGGEDAKTPFTPLLRDEKSIFALKER